MCQFYINHYVQMKQNKYNGLAIWKFIEFQKWLGKQELKGRDQKEDRGIITWEDGIKNILKERKLEWNGMKAEAKYRD